MEVRTLVKKGTDHLVYCEDDLFFRLISQSDGSDLIISGVFDGCSTGYKSHFASALYGKILKDILIKNNSIIENELSIEHISKIIFYNFFYKLKEISSLLGLKDLEIVSTFIISVVKDSEAHVIVSGDGCIHYDNETIKIESNNNEPDYLAYHLDKSPDNVYKDNIKTYHIHNFKDSFSICSDGIFSFRKQGEDNIEEKIINNLLVDVKFQQSDAMLARKYNILFKEGYNNYDDITIVRIIK